MEITSGDIAKDAVYVDHDRVWVFTFEMVPGLYETIFYGPSLPKEPSPRLYRSREAAIAGHEAALAEYGYRKTGLRQYRWGRNLEYVVKGMVSGCRRPMSRKWAWIMMLIWAFASTAPAIAIYTEGGFDFSRWTGWNNLIVGTFDGFMLYQSVRGLMWKYNFPRPRV